MVISKNGITLEVDRQGSRLTFRVTEQTKAATDILRLLGEVRDPHTGFSLKSNKHPNFNAKKKRFYVRGIESSKNKEPVEVQLRSAEEANQAVEALERLLDQVTLPEPSKEDERLIVIGNCQLHRGGTTHFRFAFLSKMMATRLELTGHKLYPENVIDWQKTDSMVINNPHWDEHANQICDVLNKSVSESNKTVGFVTNPHKVTPKQARYAVDAVRKLFADADKNDALVAVWRVVTGLRAPDVQ